MYNKFKILGFIGLAVIAVLGGVFVSKSFTTKAGSQIDAIKPADSKTDTFKQEEISLENVGSDLSIDLSNFNKNKDIVVGVKRVSGNEKSKMYASLVKLKNRKDAAKIEKNQGVKNVPKIDSLENCGFDISNGIAKLSDINAVNSSSKPLILFIQINDQSNLRLFMNDGNTIALDDTGIYRNGKFEAIPMNNPGFLISEFLNMKILEKFKEAGHTVKTTREVKN